MGSEVTIRIVTLLITPVTKSSDPLSIFETLQKPMTETKYREASSVPEL